MRKLAILILAIVIIYPGIGTIYHSRAATCYEIRHSQDQDSASGNPPGIISWTMDALFWPMFLFGDTVNKVGIYDCTPKPPATQNMNQQLLNNNVPSNELTDINRDLERNFRKILETAYPEFANFENQKSFAGKKVKFQMYENDRYYAYMTLGSGLPVTEATCFRIDRTGRVFKVGMFPDLADSYMGYRDVDPRNCKGIK